MPALSSEIVVKADGYRFTTNEWSRYTGQQILAGAAALSGLAAMCWGSYTMAAIITDRLVAQLSSGVLIQQPTSHASFLVALGIGLLGGVVFSIGVASWPSPWEYGEPIDGGER